MPSPLLRHWNLDPSVIHLNHGSFGACPRSVLELQTELRNRMESDPVRFLVREAPGILDEAREETARLLRAEPDALAFVRNATEGVNAVLRSIGFQPGDELLTTDHEYNACRNALEFAAARAGATVAVARIPFPLAAPDQAVEAVLSASGPRTKLLLIDHVTSPTGLVLPVEEIVAAFEARGVPVLVDGAHAPGMLDLRLSDLRASFYTGNAHKWLCAPKGAAILHVREDWRDRIRPLAISHGAGMPVATRSRFRSEFDWTGTSDPTPWMCIPACIRFLDGLLPGGLPALRESNRRLVLRGRDLILRRLGLQAPAPDAMTGSMAAIPLPEGPAGEASHFDFHPMQQALWSRARIEVPVNAWPRPESRLLRISAQAYNSIEDYALLADHLAALLDRRAPA